MTRYDEYPHHPLNGVPQEVLDVARKVLNEAALYRDVDAEFADGIADSVVSELLDAGFLTWPDQDDPLDDHYRDKSMYGD